MMTEQMTDQEWEEWKASLKAEADALDDFEKSRQAQWEVLDE